MFPARELRLRPDCAPGSFDKGAQLRPELLAFDFPRSVAFAKHRTPDSRDVLDVPRLGELNRPLHGADADLLLSLAFPTPLLAIFEQSSAA